METETDLQRRRELAASLGYTLREDVCTLFNVKDSTEEAWRKRGKAPAPYVVAGNAILYETAGLAESLKADVRVRANVTKGVL